MNKRFLLLFAVFLVGWLDLLIIDALGASLLIVLIGVISSRASLKIDLAILLILVSIIWDVHFSSGLGISLVVLSISNIIFSFFRLVGRNYSGFVIRIGYFTALFCLTVALKVLIVKIRLVDLFTTGQFQFVLAVLISYALFELGAYIYREREGDRFVGRGILG